ncbi:hypothetical protein GCM10009828_102920 [Actinoplanes couchii]|uniref:DivIVA domain-containing protein n=2 Tax=Actinoplanes couchii TaxID=403638 RepID=A0ABQ3XS67_9ACTN|nr:hypothetical protein Aco03nite_097650 [Actinoplanes couchii]
MVLRGYDRNEVDSALERAEKALASGDGARCRVARDKLRGASFTVVLRGYDRRQVESAVHGLALKLDAFTASPTGDLRTTLVTLLGLSEPSDEQIIDAVKRLQDR